MAATPPPPPPGYEPPADPALYNPYELPSTIKGLPNWDCEIANHWIDRTLEGETPSQIASNPDAPSVAEFHKWLLRCESLEVAYDRARMIRADIMVAEIPGIADGQGPAGDKKQRWEARLKVAGFWNPRYAPKTTTKLEGGLDIKASLAQKPLDNMEASTKRAALDYFGIGPDGA